MRKGLKVQTALSSHKAFKVLDEMMDNAGKDGDKIKAADAVLRSGKTYLGRDPGDTTIVFQLQTIKGERVFLNSPSKLDAIDVNSELDEEDKS